MVDLNQIAGGELAAQFTDAFFKVVGKDLATGELYVEEYGRGIAGQMSLDKYPTGSEGEILIETDDTAEVVDYRNKK